VREDLRRASGALIMAPRWLLLAFVVSLAGIAVLAAPDWFSLQTLKDEQQRIAMAFDRQPLLIAAVFSAIYVVSVALSLPWATLLGLAAGAIFGLGWGAAIVSLSSTLGATLAFLLARHLLGSPVRNRFGSRLGAIDRGIEREGGLYLFALRLVPLFPFFLVNLGMGLTRMPLATYVWISWLGMLPGTVVYVNAGTQLGAVDSSAGLLSSPVLISFALLGLLPLASQRFVSYLRTRRSSIRL
jgi:uncharacterized membrane protein YdjX (TVP38/TMEM64 family)